MSVSLQLNGDGLRMGLRMGFELEVDPTGWDIYGVTIVQCSEVTRRADASCSSCNSERTGLSHVGMIDPIASRACNHDVPRAV